MTKTKTAVAADAPKNTPRPRGQKKSNSSSTPPQDDVAAKDSPRVAERSAKESGEVSPAVVDPPAAAPAENAPEGSAHAASEPSERSGPTAPSPAAEWSSSDEAAFQLMMARRKAAGYRGRGRDVAGQVITVGSIKPNPGTVVATIVELVTARGSVTRGELISLMATANFGAAKAQPTDRGWCQGYVAGSLRAGFLACNTAAAPVTEKVAG